MDQAIEQVLEEARSAWRFRWPALGVAWVVALVGWGVVMLLPDTYQATTRVFVDTRTALSPLLQNLAVEQDVDAQLNFVRESLLGAPQLEPIAEAAGLITPQQIADPRKQLRVIEAMRDRISISVRSANDMDNAKNAGSIYTLSYKDGTRTRSLKIVAALLDTLVRDTLGGKSQGSEDAQKFLQAQIADYETRLRAAENKLADFKKAHVDVMPNEQGGYFTRLQTEMDAVKTTETALAVAQSRRDELNRQLRGESAVSAASAGNQTSGSQGARLGGDTLSQIQQAQARLDDLLLNYTDKHPDVIAERKTLEELKRRREAELEAVRRGDPGAVASSGASSNPVYQSIQTALNQAEVEIATLTRQLEDHRSRVTQLREALDTVPKVEADYAQLNRDYDVNKAQYTALVTQLEKAKLGQEADTSGSVRFEVIEPPNAEFKPISPRRSVLVLLVLCLALGAGGGVAYLLQRIRPVFWSAKALARATGARVLGAVGSAFHDQVARESRRDLIWYSLTVACLVALGLIALAFSLTGRHLMLPVKGVGGT
jgi:polysaccharide chain length determinant protein (PEP-CTERM system associated)